MESSIGVLKFAEARASEILSVTKEVTCKEPKLISQRLPHHMRRRAASHNPKRLPRSVRNAIANQVKSSKRKKRKHIAKNLPNKYNKRQLNSCWLPTHIWFAKRFHMKSLWGYKLPQHSTGKHFRTAYKSGTRRTLLQDMSYYCCIELRGLQENLLSKLSSLTNDSLGPNFSSDMYIDGSKEGHCFLYQPNAYPFKAIGQVSFLWRPLACDSASDMFEPTSKGIRQLWIWCHPSIHNEIMQVFIDIFHLKEVIDLNKDTALENKGFIKNKKDNFASKVNYSKTSLYFKKEKKFASNEVTMMLLKNTLVRHRLFGPLALPVIASVLKMADVSLTSSGISAPVITTTVQVTGPDQAQLLSNGELWWQKYYQSKEAKSVHISKCNLFEKMKDFNYGYMLPQKIVIGLTVKDPRLNWSSKSQEFCNFSHGNSEFDSSLSNEFLSSFASSALWEKEIRDEVTETQMPEHQLNLERSKYISAKEELKLGLRENKVPIIIIHQVEVNGIGSAWDLIAPQGWGMAFWIPLIYSGTQAAGLRDVNNLYFEAGLPNFPYSFPDCTAGRLYEKEDQEENVKKYFKYPPSKRPNFSTLGVASPFGMPWGVLLNDWENEIKSQVSPDLEFKKLLLFYMNSTEHSVEDSVNNFFVVRSKICIRSLKDLSYNYCHTSLPYVKKTECDSALRTFIKLCVSEVKFFTRSLILVKIKCLKRGTPKKFSGIYLPNSSDLKLMEDNKKLPCPVEPQHGLPSRKKQKVDKKQKMQEIEKLISSWVKIESLISQSERKIIGFISEGGFSSHFGFGSGIGHCALIGFLTVMKNCSNFQIQPTVLFKEQNSFQYRVASIEVITAP